MRLALYQPDIPQNTGTILRMAACLNIPVDVIGPTGFDMSDRALKRAALDYLPFVDLTRFVSWEAFQAARQVAVPPRRLVLLSSKAATIASTSASLRSRGCFLVFIAGYLVSV